MQADCKGEELSRWRQKRWCERGLPSGFASAMAVSSHSEKNDNSRLPPGVAGQYPKAMLGLKLASAALPRALLHTFPTRSPGSEPLPI